MTVVGGAACARQNKQRNVVAADVQAWTQIGEIVIRAGSSGKQTGVMWLGERRAARDALGGLEV